jgi:uncharacterized membrane protein
MMDWHDRGGHMSTGGWIFMVLGMVILIAVLVALVMWIVSQQRTHAHGPGTLAAGMSPREALDHRLVSGEVTPEQYDQLRVRLDGETPPGSAGSAAPPS